MEISIPDSPHFRNIIAIVFGLTATAMTVGSVEMLSHQIYPELSEIDYDDDAQMISILDEAPPLALIGVIMAWALGIGGGCLIAGILGADQGTFCCIVLSGVVLLMAVTTLNQLPAPDWFAFFGLLALVPSGFVGWWSSQRIVHKLRASGNDAPL